MHWNRGMDYTSSDPICVLFLLTGLCLSSATICLCQGDGPTVFMPFNSQSICFPHCWTLHHLVRGSGYTSLQWWTPTVNHHYKQGLPKLRRKNLNMNLLSWDSWLYVPGFAACWSCPSMVASLWKSASMMNVVALRVRSTWIRVLYYGPRSSMT